MEPTEPAVLVRTPSGTWLPILVWAMAAWMAVDAVWRAGLAGLRYWPVLALIAWAAYLLLWAPRVLVGSDFEASTNSFSFILSTSPLTSSE